MTVLVLVLAFSLFLLGFLGSFIPGLPGPPLSYLGVLIIHFFTPTQFSNSFLFTWALVVVAVFVLDYMLQAWGVKKFGGGRKATIGTFIGLFVGLLFPPIGLLIGPFAGAFIGALSEVKGDNTRAFKVAIGSFIGFVTGTVLKVGVSTVLVYYSICNIWF
jgi:uncharacterized protein YqgC (DUF456 family)